MLDLLLFLVDLQSFRPRLERWLWFPASRAEEAVQARFRRPVG